MAWHRLLFNGHQVHDRQFSHEGKPFCLVHTGRKKECKHSPQKKQYHILRIPGRQWQLVMVCTGWRACWGCSLQSKVLCAVQFGEWGNAFVQGIQWLCTEFCELCCLHGVWFRVCASTRMLKYEPPACSDCCEPGMACHQSVHGGGEIAAVPCVSGCCVHFLGYRGGAVQKVSCSAWGWCG